MASTTITAISYPYKAKRGGLIILGESAYPSGDYKPDYKHTKFHPRWVIKNWYKNDVGVSNFDRCVIRAITNCYDPTPEQLAEVWRGDVGIANFIGPSTPPDKRPTREQWRASQAAFRPWINKWRPARLLVLGAGRKTAGREGGNTTYDWLPSDPEIHVPRRDTPVAYLLKDGSFTICHGILHPRGSTWQKVRQGLDELRHWHVINGKLVKCEGVMSRLLPAKTSPR